MPPWGTRLRPAPPLSADFGPGAPFSGLPPAGFGRSTAEQEQMHQLNQQQEQMHQLNQQQEQMHQLNRGQSWLGPIAWHSAPAKKKRPAPAAGTVPSHPHPP